MAITGYVVIGALVVAASRLGNDAASIEAFFRIPGVLLTLWLCGVGLHFNLRVWRAFESGEPMRMAWKLIAVSATSGLAGSVLIQLFGTGLPAASAAAGSSRLAMLRGVGMALDGQFRFAALAAGLFLVLRIYRRAGCLARLRAIDWVPLAVFGAFIVREAVEAVQRWGIHPLSAREWMNLQVDPLLWILLWQALLLFRSVRRMGKGWISQCYAAFCLGIALVLLGDAATWAGNWGYLPWLCSAVGAYAWIPAAGAFAVAPALQWEAMRSATLGDATAGQSSKLLNLPAHAPVSASRGHLRACR
ncbi:MAG: hypothetical protein ABI759_15760 [Candidatus Solibacter sp.]